MVLAVSVALAQDVLEDRALKVVGPPAGEALAGAELQLVTEEVTSLMRCPVCQGLSVADSSTPSALAMRAKAERLLASGYDREQVLEYFEASYGEFIRLAPKPKGFNLFVWIVPAIGLLLGGGLIWWRTRAGSAGPEIVDVDPELEAYRDRVRQEAAR
jgi:cytochrome c-type biogenesis protein CcmH